MKWGGTDLNWGAGHRWRRPWTRGPYRLDHRHKSTKIVSHTVPQFAHKIVIAQVQSNPKLISGRQKFLTVACTLPQFLPAVCSRASRFVFHIHDRIRKGTQNMSRKIAYVPTW